MSNSKFSYYTTCLLSGIIELGTVFLGAKLGYSLPKILGFALAYQLGNVLRFLVNKKISRYQTLCVFTTVLFSVLVTFLLHNLFASYIVLCCYYVLYSTFLQNIRSTVQGDIPRWKKRSCRVMGFMLSFGFYLMPNVLLIIASLLLLYFSITEEKFYYDDWAIKWFNGEYSHRICWAMVFHQAHYFVYNYVLLYLVLKRCLNPSVAAMCFVANWIPYTITEPIVKRLKLNCWYTIAILAHFFNAIVLFGMYMFFETNIWITIVLWVLTGFGGGNVFCVKKALSERMWYEKTVWNFSEQIGHVLGVLVAIIVCISRLPFKTTMIVSIFFALCTISILAKECNRRK